MDSFFLAEMFKYLYLLFADKEDIIFDIEDYIFTTEAHLLPLWLSTTNQSVSKKDSVSFLLSGELPPSLSVVFCEPEVTGSREQVSLVSMSVLVFMTLSLSHRHLSIRS